MSIITFLNTYPIAFYILMAILGLLIGSFLNVVIVRLPKMLHHAFGLECALYLETTPPESPALNLCWPNSHCPQCKQAISVVDNIPLISFFLLKGKCRHCTQPIAWRYPIVEALSLFMTLWAALVFGFSIALIPALLLVWSLIVLSFIDFEHLFLPDNLVQPLLWLGLLGSYFYPDIFIPLPQALLGAAAGYLSLWSIYWVFRLLTGKEGLGQGDFKLLAMLGAWTGYMALPMIIFIASTLGAIVGIGMLLTKKLQKGQPMPFGPYLALAGWLVYCHAAIFVEGYWHWILP